MNAGKRLIFTATSGRSGTAYLAQLLQSLPDTKAVHEPIPGFQELLPVARHNGVAAARFLRDIRLPDIYAQPGEIYVETSHYFTKGFVEPMLELGVVPDLIVLTRDSRQVAASWFMLGASLQGFREGKRSRRMIGPNEPNFLPVRDWENWNDYQFCYWYALESSVRAQHYAHMIAAKGGRIFSTTLEQLTTDEGYRELLIWIGIKENIIAELLLDTNKRSTVVNKRSSIKDQHGREDALAAMEIASLEAQIRLQCGIK